MKKDLPPAMIPVIVVAVLVGAVLSSLSIHGASKSDVTIVAPLPSGFPDVKNDSHYSNFLNSYALDPAQVVKVGNSQNNSPFNASTGQ